MRTDGRIDGQTEMTKATLAFRTFVNGPKKVKFPLLHATNAHGGEKVYLHIFFASALDGGEWSDSRSGPLYYCGRGPQ